MKPYMPPDDDAEWVNPECTSCLLPVGQTKHIPFPSQEHHKRIQSEMVTGPHVNTTNTQHIWIASQNSTKVVRGQQPVVDESSQMPFGGVVKGS